MARGRPPKSTAQKRAAGNPGKRKLNDQEPDFTALLIAPPAPEWLNDYAQVVWDKLAPQLVDSKVLTSTDLHNLECFASAYGRWRMAEADINKNGIVVMGAMGSEVKNPACTVANEAMRQMATYGGALGLDPASRSRLMVPTAKKKSAFAEFLGGN